MEKVGILASWQKNGNSHLVCSHFDLFWAVCPYFCQKWFPGNVKPWPRYRIAGTILLPGQNSRWIFVVRKRASVYTSASHQGADVQIEAFLRTTNISSAQTSLEVSTSTLVEVRREVRCVDDCWASPFCWISRYTRLRDSCPSGAHHTRRSQV